MGSVHVSWRGGVHTAMKKVVAMPWVFEIAWANPYTSPPDGQTRVLMSVTRVQTSGHPVPPEIDERYRELGFGTGWCLRVSHDITATYRPKPLEAKQKLRRTALARRVAAKAPLFADQLIQAELERQPEYYGVR